ncbi:hypothetical protein AB0L99_44015 [Streptomyces sp. NPDC051954]|uniref:Zn-ribbon domain-containing OB-fold protein n=1 Tax=unclassified Streptomyces TaxID=2593676 RepID=UPI00342121B9
MSHSVIEPTASGLVERGSALPGTPQTDPDRPCPIPTGGIRDGVLYFQRCRWCQTSVIHCLLCPACGSTDLAEERSGGIGVIQHVTVVGRSVGKHRAIAIVEMSEGFHVRERVSAVPLNLARVGAQVRLGFGPRPQEIAFQLCDS